MTLTAGSNTYISVTDADSYFAGRLYSSVWTSATSGDKEAALRVACRALDRENWVGVLATTSQTLCWPRSGVSDKDGRELDQTAIPQFLKDAQCELALTYLADDPTQDDGTAGVRRIDAGGVSIEYDGRAPVRRLPDVVKAIIKPYLAFGGAGDGSSAPLVF